jgi:arylsulfatase A-like enzyme
MALAVLDDAVEDVYDAITSAGEIDNTYFIFASDNGGCAEAGGRNYPLRGQKGSIFEGTYN